MIEHNQKVNSNNKKIKIVSGQKKERAVGDQSLIQINHFSFA
jgi:hypothetical protein